MNVQTVSKGEITNLLNNWYQSIISQHVLKSTNYKNEIDSKIHQIEEDQNILIYYSLLDFRYKLLTHDVKNYKDSLEKIDCLPDQADNFLRYYHSFFKAIYSINMGDYTSAKEQYEEAEMLLKDIPDELEIAEFNYMFGSFHYHIYQPLPAIKYTTKAKELFSKHAGYEIKVAACNNTLGLACTSLGQYESAEEHFLTALNTFNKHDEDKLSAKVKHNLGLLYADQNLSELAIKYLNGSIVNNQKTLFLLAQEYFKLNDTNAVRLHIENGLKISNEEYTHHFNILKGLNDNISTDELEDIILAGISYFKKEELWKYVKDYSAVLGNKFYELKSYEKASKYLHMTNEADKKASEKGALK
ncbi:tetratricopeptide repeat protein [Bacillus thuringiensis]|uniref:Rap family tetratricopeptide repeat protein n=1 Tax=Bacillus TaxID=1386 RepID=UPI00032E813E|nr:MULTISPECIES: Rap family tetratricopeptide repeat protein [Bacillus]AJQ62551.1 aspartate phosphatase [Bacillus thuringiensis serovar morrisoni]EOO04921.1 hypothetical protein IAW_05739 [Bacillus cereus str. Schrouff]EOO81745.1 hypothetical protein IGY_05767 [Bacillus cereus K-5975c]MED3102605.1 tetratricopeptide repeat protein [Bacillus thuringiensis]MRB00084.1 hypothetical protein [Bacillus thuringiensis]